MAAKLKAKESSADFQDCEIGGAKERASWHEEGELSNEIIPQQEAMKHTAPSAAEKSISDLRDCEKGGIDKTVGGCEGAELKEENVSKACGERPASAVVSEIEANEVAI